jgi:uncharacterized protein RhaS with RHS repeats
MKTLFVCFLVLTYFSVTVYSQSYTYDANGNMVSDSESGRCYEYNAANQLKRVTDCAGTAIADYFYDTTGQRIMTVEYNSTGNIQPITPSTNSKPWSEEAMLETQPTSTLTEKE